MLQWRRTSGLALLAAAAIASGMRDQGAATTASQELPALELVGEPCERLLEELGPPSWIGSSTRWYYAGPADDDDDAPYFVVHQGVVVGFHPGRVPLPVPRAVPSEGIYLGQPVAEAARELGAPLEGVLCWQGKVYALRFREGPTLCFAEGRVIGIEG